MKNGIWNLFQGWFGKKPEPKNDWSMTSDCSWWPFMGRTMTTSGIRVDERSGQAYSAVFCSLRILSETLATLPAQLLEQTDQRTTKKAIDHPLWRIVHDIPNPEQDSMQFFDMQTALLAGWGDCYAEIVRDDFGGVRALTPIHPSRIPVRNITRNQTDPSYWHEITVGQPGEIIYWVMNDDATETPIPASDMLHVTGVLSENGITGKSIIRAGADSIGVAIATEQHAGAFFRNGASPNIAITSPKTLGKEAADRLRLQWQQVFGGVANHYKTIFLEDGMAVSPFNISPEDSQLLGARQFGVSEIARWFRIPPHMLYDLTRSTYSNIESQGQDFISYSFDDAVDRALGKGVVSPIAHAGGTVAIPIPVQHERLLARRRRSAGLVLSNDVEHRGVLGERHS